MSNAQLVIRSLLKAVVALAVFYPQSGHTETDYELLLFPYVKPSFLGGLASDSALDSEDLGYGLGFFGTLEKGRFQFLGEALVSEREQEIERLQLGWKTSKYSAWLGKFHNPIGFWNTQYHHGLYLQSSISRPSIVEYEDDGGLLPMHLAGLLIQGVAERDVSALGYAIALAAGPELEDGLESWDVLSPSSGSHGSALSVNVYRQPVAYGATQYGLFSNYTEIPVSNPEIDEIRQTIAGTYLNWESDSWRVVSSVFYVRNRFVTASGNRTDDFYAVYLQAEKLFDNSWTIFGRAEETFADSDDAYLALFPEHVRQKLVAGLRLDFLDRHAVSLEVSSNRIHDDRYRELALLWTAMF